MHRSMRWGSLALATFALLPSAVAGARARHHRVCSPSNGRLSPQLLSPCNHATVTAGKVFTFKVRDLNPGAGRYHPFINLTKRAPRHGVLKDDTSGSGLFEELHAVRGHKGLFSLRPKLFTFPGYWLVTPGRYYVQVQQVDCSVHGCRRYSPVETITVR